MKQNQLFMSWLLLLFFQFPSFSSSLNFLCHHHESDALLQFKSSFTLSSDYNVGLYCGLGEPYHQKTATWKNGSDCCSWDGVTCDTISGHVIGLNLGCEGLTGELHPNSSLFHLSHLQKLNLSNIDFIDSHFHFKFGRFQSLTHLDLSDCNFKGEIPVQISHLFKLESLHLSKNFDLIWKENTLKRLVQNATNLKELFLDYTDMFSIRPNSMELIFNQSSSLVILNLRETGLSGKLKKSLLCLPSIQELDMSWNDHLEGQLPEFSCSTSLRILDLSECQFKGPIPLSFSNLTHFTSLIISNNNLNGSIQSSLLTLPRLTYLDLSRNDLSGQIPNVFPQSNRFQELDFSTNKIGGLLPTTLSNLQQLTHLSLSYNSFNGKIPDVFGGMTKLKFLGLTSNNLEGQIPSSLFTLTHQLVKLDCSYNKFEGHLPNNITGFQKLTTLRLNDNLLHGTIPSSLLSLPSLVNLDIENNNITGHIGAISSYSLETLYLCGNMLQGNIPESIFNLANLIALCLSSNNFSGVINFQHFSRLQNLYYLSLSHNTQLSLTFESNVKYNFPLLEELKLSSLSLTQFPNLLGNLPSLYYLDLSNNKLNGRVPNWLLETSVSLNLSQNGFTSIDQISLNIVQLNSLDLSFNLLEGDISLSICSMKSLQLLNLAHNKLTDTIPQCLANLSNLHHLDLQMNRFVGGFLSDFSKDCDLHVLNLYGNQIEDSLPVSLSRCKMLEFLNLGSNKIEDRYPEWLQTLPNLKVLVLRDNKLHGPIAGLKIKHPYPSLVIFDISGNNFSGPLPKAYFKNFKAMKIVTQVGENISRGYIMDSEGSYDSVTVMNKGINMTLVRIPINFVGIDLSRNKFEGEIPNAIGELHALIYLNLSHNRLISRIPQSMGNLTNLESLDLSSNMLTGVIPAELTHLGFLEVLNLSNNYIVGEIPQGPQFNTFSNDSYEENSGLCGLPLSKKCGPGHHSPASANNFWNEEKFEFGWKPVAIGYGCGFVIGIGLGYFVLLIGKPRWLVMLFGGQPKRRVIKRRTRVRRTNGSIQNQTVQMS